MMRCRARRRAGAWGALLPVGIVLVVLGLQLATVRDGHDWGGDFSLYLAHANNLATGVPYGETGFLYSPRNPFVSPPTYPPGFPLLLAPVVAWVGIDFAALKTVCVVAFACALGVGYVALRGHLCRAERWTWMLVVGLNPYLWQFRQSILSDLPFLVCVLAALAMAAAPTAPGAGQWRRAVLCGLAMGAAVATRSVGLVLPVALVMAARGRRGKNRRFVIVACAVVFAMLVLQNQFMHQDAAYLDQVLPFVFDPAFLLDMVRATLSGWTSGWVSMWSSSAGPIPSQGVAALMLLLAVGGFVLRVRRRGWAIHEVFTLLYLGVVLLWPMARDPRFLIPILPMGVAYALVAVRLLGRRVTPHRLRTGLARAMAVGLILHVGSGAWTVVRTAPGPDITDADARHWFAFLRAHTDRDDVLIAAKPRVVALMTARRCAALVPPTDFGRHVAETGARYVVLAGLPEERIASATLAAEAGRWTLTYAEGPFAVYRIPDDRDEPGSGLGGTDH